MLILKRPVSKKFSISSPFGERVIRGVKGFHNGYDFKVPVGTEVFACEDGAAFRCGWQDDRDHKLGYGLRVWQEIERHEDNKRVRYFIWYGHLSKILIKEGDRIKQGQIIALSGNTGRSTSPHLHMGARQLDQNAYSEIDWI